MEFFKDKFGYSLADDEIVEEEIIERDEEYDVEGGEYDDGYDDESYNEYDEYDEEYYDEGEEYPPEEEYYDDGYEEYPPVDNGKMDRVLDELAELRRSMGMPAVLPAYTHPPAPQHPYIITPPAANSNNEVAIYNEISRLRNELGKTQTSQEMHLELSRLKEQMERDSRRNEEGLLNEIRRLNERVSDLQSGGQSKATPARTTSFNGDSVRCVGEEVLREEFARLIEINEAILQTVKETDKKSHAAVAEIRKRVAAMPDLTTLSKTVDSLKETVSKTGGGANPELIREIKEVKAAVTGDGFSVGSSPNLSLSAIETKIDEIKSAAPIIDNSELLRQICELKALIGSASVGVAKRDRAMLELYNEFARVKIDCGSSHISLSDKLAAADTFAKKLAESGEPDAEEIYRSLLLLTAKLLSEKLTKTTLDDLNEFMSVTGAAGASQKKQNAAETYVRLLERMKRLSALDAIDLLTELLSVIDEMQDSRLKDRNDAAFSEILNLAEAYSVSPNDDPALAVQIKNKIESLCIVTAGDYLAYTPVRPSRAYKSASTLVDGGTLMDKLNELKAVVSDLPISSVPVSSGEAPVSSASNGIILQEINNLKTELYPLLKSDVILSEIRVLKDGYSEILQRIDAIDLAAVMSSVESVPATDERLTRDVAYIKNKIEDQDAILSQISELRTDVISITGEYMTSDRAMRTVAQTAEEPTTNFYDSLKSEIDKLYEDLAATIGAGNEPISKRLEEIGSAVENTSDSVSVLHEINLQIAADIAEIKRKIQESFAQSDALIPKQAASDAAAEALNEQIAELRTQLQEKSEQQTAEQSEEVLNQMMTIAAKLDILEAGAGNADATIIGESTELMLSDISEKLTAMLYGEGESPDNIQLIISDLAVIRENIEKLAEETAILREGGIGRGQAGGPSEQEVLILEDLNEIKSKLNSGSQMTTKELEDVKNEVQLSRLRDTAEIVEELDKIYSELRGLHAGVAHEVNDMRSEMTGYRDVATTPADIELVLKEIAALRDELKGEAPANSEVNMIYAEIIALRDEVEAYRKELTQIRETAAPPEGAGQTADNNADAVNLLLDEVATLRAEVQAYNEELITAQKSEIELVKASVDALTDTVARTTEVTETQSAPASSDELNLVLEELFNLKAEREADMREIKDLLASLLENRTGYREEPVSAVESEYSKSEAVAAVAEDIAAIKDQLAELSANYPSVPLTSDYGSISQVLEELAVLRDEVSLISQSVFTDEKTTDSAVFDEINALRGQISALSDTMESRAEYTAAAAPASIDGGGILGELEALKDEFAILNERLSAQGFEVTTPAAAEPADNIAVLEEINFLKEQIAALSDLLAEGYASTSDISNDAADIAADNAEVLNEITVLRDQLTAMNDLIAEGLTAASTVPAEQNSSAVSEGSEELLYEIAELKEQIAAILDILASDKSGAAGSPQTESLENDGGILDQLKVINERIDGLNDTVSFLISEDGIPPSAAVSAPQMSVVLDELSAIKEELLAIGAKPVYESSDGSASETDLSELFAGITEIRSELSAIADQMTSAAHSASSKEGAVDTTRISETLETLSQQIALLPTHSDMGGELDTIEISETLAVLNEQVENLSSAGAAVDSASEYNEELGSSVNLLFEELNSLKEQISVLSEQISAGSTAFATDALADNETVGAVLEELTALRAQIAGMVGMNGAEDTDETVLSEIIVLNERITSLEDALRSQNTESEMPDLSVINEVLALRDEFQAFKDEMIRFRDEKSELASEPSSVISADAEQAAQTALEVLTEIRSLRDQLFAISMASVSVPGGTKEYESYNNIILDEISVLREEVARIKENDTVTAAVSSELADIRESVSRGAGSESIAAIEKQLSALSADIESIAAVSARVEELRGDFADFAAGSETLVNFMSEVAMMVERQNTVIQNLSGSSAAEIDNRLAEMKREIAATVTEASRTSVREMAKLKEEISREKGSKTDSEQVLREIRRVKDELTVLGEKTERTARSLRESKEVKETKQVKEARNDRDLSESISELKEELNSIAELVGGDTSSESPVPKKRKTTKRRTQTSSSQTATSDTSTGSGSSASGMIGGIQNSSSGTRSSSDTHSTDENITVTGVRRRSPIGSTRIETLIEESTEEDDLLARIDQESLSLRERMEVEIATGSTTDDLDLAERIARQVANKLIMEQLVHQLGDGVPQSQVEEIVKDILPQEFSTIQIDSQSDKVRRLANSLVLDKLRARLTGKK